MRVSIFVLCAILGNFWTESGINSGIWESLVVKDWTSQYSNNTGGYGLGQWTNTGTDYGRLYNLHQYLVNNGYADDSEIGQFNYIEVENVWHKGTDAQKDITFSTLSEFLASSSTDLDYLTKSWLLCWEGINNGTLSARQEHAKTIYDYIVANKDTKPSTFYKGNRYLSESERLNNALYLYQIFCEGGDTPTPEPPTPEPKPTPISKKLLYMGGIREMLRRHIIYC